MFVYVFQFAVGSGVEVGLGVGKGVNNGLGVIIGDGLGKNELVYPLEYAK